MMGPVLFNVLYKCTQTRSVYIMYVTCTVHLYIAFLKSMFCFHVQVLQNAPRRISSQNSAQNNAARNSLELQGMPCYTVNLTTLVVATLYI